MSRASLITLHIPTAVRLCARPACAAASAAMAIRAWFHPCATGSPPLSRCGILPSVTIRGRRGRTAFSLGSRYCLLPGSRRRSRVWVRKAASRTETLVRSSASEEQGSHTPLLGSANPPTRVRLPLSPPGQMPGNTKSREPFLIKARLMDAPTGKLAALWLLRSGTILDRLRCPRLMRMGAPETGLMIDLA